MVFLKGLPLARQKTQTLESSPIKNTLIRDCIFLGAVVLVVQGLVVHKLGFYSDDWAFLSIFHHTADKSWLNLIQSFFSQDQVARMRPIQIVNLATLYWMFGTDPLGYHIANSFFLLLVILLFYLSLRALSLPHLLSVSIPLVFALLPNYSTDRIWLATFQTNISIAFFFLNFLALTQVVKEDGNRVWRWGILATFSVVISLLAYEIILPMFLINFSLLAWDRKRGLHILQTGFSSRQRLILLLNVLAFGLCIIYKSIISVRTGGFHSSYWEHILYVYDAGMRNDFIAYGLKLPKVIWKIFSTYLQPSLLVIGLLLGMLIFLYLRRTREVTYGASDWLKVLVAGMIVYWMGYLIFLTTSQFMVHPTGLANRVTMAASIGIAITFIGFSGFLSCWIPSANIRRNFLPLAVAGIAFCGFIINCTIATFYHQAFPVQLKVLTDLRTAVPSLSNNSVVLIDGVCPYVGPAPVLECHWDVTGILRIFYDLENVQGDFRNKNFRHNSQGVTTSIYGEERFYPYHENLIIYNHQTNQKTVLKNATVAEAYFKNSTFNSSNSCPVGEEGYGVNIF
ncbi:hypothetical protein ACD591_14820 [Rufibacter glacialis]|uniref:Glycosyltransferase RgtA/B/C/D-like domain-containing protein n=1 Tax=Rufibacter glacialis TaxID=1259555 RepID=A0A5M8QT09_9BACT|nr:hypothetical protein [Rufibacter glacialis]KAA6437766.1 hypothetical protein FOE74_04505 [Rufibacter glacialis]GGK56455.1 hypothetical protein GCM10011405_00740 [Rufibacter glacialis]